MKASSLASPPSSAAGVPNAMQVFQNAAAGQPANDGPVTGNGIDDVMDAYPPAIDAALAGDGQGPASSANAMQVFQNAAAGQPANDSPVAGSQIDDAMAPYPSVPDMMSADHGQDSAANAYPLAIQGLLGDGVYAQPYMDAVNRLGLAPAPARADPYVVRKGDTLYGITHGDYGFLSPYTSSVISATQAQANQNQQMALNQLGDQAQAAGAFGGSRQGVAQALTLGQYDMNNQQTAAQLNNQNYSQALQAATTQNEQENQYPLAVQSLLGQLAKGTQTNATDDASSTSFGFNPTFSQNGFSLGGNV